MKKLRYLFLIALVAAVLLLSCGCSAAEVKEDALYAETFSHNSTQYEAIEDAGDAEMAYADATATVQEGRKLIKRVNLTVETQTFDDYLTTLEHALADHQGYVQSSNVYGSSRRTAQYTVRVPVQALEGFLEAISQKGVIAARSTSQDDVTLTYVDTQAHITALRAEETSLLRLLEEAGSLEDVISLQNRLSDVRYEIESYESQLRSLDNLIDYATVNFTVEEVEREEPVLANPTTWEKIDDNWASGFRFLGSFLKGLFIFLASALPFIAIVAAAAFLVLLFAVIIPRHKKKKANRKTEENE